ncbi:WG repeat-containing protein [Paenibacillus rhizoplanae]
MGSGYGYINSSGKMVIKAQYNSAEDFSEGAALVTINGTSHYIDKKGKFFCSIQAIKKTGSLSRRDWRLLKQELTMALLIRKGN